MPGDTKHSLLSVSPAAYRYLHPSSGAKNGAYLEPRARIFIHTRRLKEERKVKECREGRRMCQTKPG